MRYQAPLRTAPSCRARRTTASWARSSSVSSNGATVAAGPVALVLAIFAWPVTEWVTPGWHA